MPQFTYCYLCLRNIYRHHKQQIYSATTEVVQEALQLNSHSVCPYKKSSTLCSGYLTLIYYTPDYLFSSLQPLEASSHTLSTSFDVLCCDACPTTITQSLCICTILISGETLTRRNSNSNPSRHTMIIGNRQVRKKFGTGTDSPPLFLNRNKWYKTE